MNSDIFFIDKMIEEIEETKEGLTEEDLFDFYYQVIKIIKKDPYAIKNWQAIKNKLKDKDLIEKIELLL